MKRASRDANGFPANKNFEVERFKHYAGEEAGARRGIRYDEGRKGEKMRDGTMKKIACGLAMAFAANAWSTEGWEAVTVPATVDLHVVAFPHPDTGYVLGDSGTVLKSTDGGDTWQAISTGIRTRFVDAQFLTPRLGWVLGKGAAGDDTLYRTLDAGLHWEAVSGAADFYSARFAGTDTGYALFRPHGGARIGLYKSLNGGAQWQVLDSAYAEPRYENVHGIRAVDARNAWTFGGSADFQYFPRPSPLGGPYILWYLYPQGRKTTNGGSDWTSVPGLLNRRVRDLHFHNRDTAWIAADDGRNFLVFDSSKGSPKSANGSQLAKTTDGGITWIDGPGYGKILNSVHFRGKDTGYAVGENGFIVKTTNGGALWASRTIVPGISLNSVVVASAARAFAVGAQGTLLRGDVSFVTSVRSPETSFRQGRPSRFTSFRNGKLSYRLPYAARVSITVRDLQGRERLRLRDAVEAPGMHAATLSLAGLPAGNYLLDFRAGGIRESWPLIKKP